MKLSVLDMVPVSYGEDLGTSFANAAALAKHAERLGFYRYWISETHANPGMASSAPAIVMGYILAHTSRIRVGSGGILLPNVSAFQAVEQVGTLEALYPGRIDLGVGRAPGGNRAAISAIGSRSISAGALESSAIELIRAFRGQMAEGLVAVPGSGMDIPLFILDSSRQSARIAGQLGLGYAYAAHMGAEELEAACSEYHSSFVAGHRSLPYLVLSLPIVAAPDHESANYQYSSSLQGFISYLRGNAAPLPPPIACVHLEWTKIEEDKIRAVMREAIVDSVPNVANRLRDVQNRCRPDEIMATFLLHGLQARVENLSNIAEAFHLLSADKVEALNTATFVSP